MGVPGFWLFIVSEVLLAILLLISIPYLRYPVGKAFSAIVFSALVWVSFYTLELSSTSLAVKIFAMRVEYLGITMVPLSFFIMAVINTRKTVIRPVWILLGSFALIFLITVWFIPHPNAFWSFIDPPIPDTGEFVPVRTYGPMFYTLFIPYSHGLMTIALILLITRLNRESLYYWRQLALFTIGMFLPAGINFVYVIGFSPVEGVNYATASMGVSSLLIGYALLKYRFLEYYPVTRDSIIEAMSDGILVFDIHGFILDANSAAEEILLIDDMIGKKVRQCLPSPILEKISDYIERVEPCSFTLDQEGRFFDYRFKPIAGASGHQSGFLLTIRDVSEKERYHREVLRISRLDPLTEVLNRKALVEEMEVQLQKANRKEGSLSLIMVDIDDFKQVNDTYGHDTGDRVIDVLKDVLLEAAGSRHFVGRFGGDEFIVACIDITEAESVTLAEHILLAVSEKGKAFGDLQLHVSAGVSSSDTLEGTLSPDRLLTQADQMLYRAKRGGKNQVFSPSK